MQKYIDVKEALRIRDNFAKYKSVESILVQGDNKCSPPKYTIAIPTYKRVDTLKETLESALGQDYHGDFDVIICDNNPERNDETELYISRIKDNRLIYYKNKENIGMTGNWNRCVELSDGEYIVMIHDDDILYPFFLSKCSQILNKTKSIKILYPAKLSWNQSECANYPIPNRSNTARLYKLHLLDFFFQGTAPTGVLFNRQIILRLGGFCESVYPVSDLYFNVKAIENTGVYAYAFPLSVYRWGINESVKLKTLIDFIQVYNPLRIYLGKKIGIPPFLVKYTNRHYCYHNYNVIKEKLPEELPNIDMKIFDLPKGNVEFLIYNIFYFIITRFSALLHKVTSRIV